MKKRYVIWSLLVGAILAVGLYFTIRKFKQTEEPEDLIDWDDSLVEDAVAGTPLTVANNNQVPNYCKLKSHKNPSTKNFTLSEFSSKDAKLPPKIIHGNIYDLMKNLQVLRDETGKAVKINSAYRTPEHNAAVGGATSSLHMCGMAADIRVQGMTPKQVETTIKKLIADGIMHAGGIKAYSTFVHYDVGPSRTW